MPTLYNSLLLPQNHIAEEILLGSLIIYPELFTVITQNITIEYFFIESHQIIYRNLNKIQQKNSIDPVNLIYSLEETKALKKIGGLEKIIELIKQSQIFTCSTNIDFYIKELIKIIHQNYNKRLIIQYGYNIVQLAYYREFSNQQLYIKASKYLNDINNKMNSQNLDNLQDLVGFLIKNIQSKNNISIKSNKIIYSDFKELDILTNGLPNGNLIVIAGRPSMGKTSFAINIAYNLIKYFYTKICIFSLEMTKIQILNKLISIASQISIHEILSGKINTNDWYLIQNICNELLKSHIYINDNPNVSIDDIEYISKIILKDKITYTNIIIIDYLQLIKTRNLNIESRNQELSYITRKLKILAQILDTPIIILSQLNRSIEKRINKKPLLSDLKESGCLSNKIFTNIDYTNRLNIKNLIKYKYQISVKYFSGKLNNIRHKQDNSYNYIKSIYIVKQYIFNCNINKKLTILITDNHKYLNIRKWLAQNQLQENHKITKYKNKYHNLNKIEKIFLQKIVFSANTLVYDIEKYEYSNFICNDIIVHNSIEQDADIVMILYQNQVNQENSIYSKIIDIIVAKNRNGPIGSFQLIFNSQNTLFTNI